ncbi:hypothetical protein QUB56_09875 [Microcoleus sp. AR_TQ3_B6]|uniref:hypothetical protein n=1 Tax=Microcoleus sp. AR_TQ3_B6 TaxID=3055284 RepID=UPI002FD098B0
MDNLTNPPLCIMGDRSDMISYYVRSITMNKNASNPGDKTIIREGKLLEPDISYHSTTN